MAQQPASSSARPVGQPLPRMTDSMAMSQAGPGPSSYKLAALSAQSYHLDSPPFTGAAGPLGDVGPLHNEVDQIQQQSYGNHAETSDRAYISSLDGPSGTAEGDRTVSAAVSNDDDTDTNAEKTPFANAAHGGLRRPAMMTQVKGSGSSNDSDARGSSSRTHSTDPARAPNGKGERGMSTDRQTPHDHDVPHWHLDGAQRAHNLDDVGHDEQNSQADRVDAWSHDADVTTPSAEWNRTVGHPAHLHSSSLSPPPFSSAGPGPLSGTAATSRHNSNESNGSQAGRLPRRREMSRPTFTQTSRADAATSHLEDAASVTTAGAGPDEGFALDEEGDADADEDLHLANEGEDGNEQRPFVHRFGIGQGPSPVRKMPLQSQTKEGYRFPRHRLPTRMRNESKIPLVIVACGSFSPPTYLHLRIFEMAKDQVIESGKYELLGGYYSPVSDYYKKEGLAKATHRVRMCELAVEKTSTWLMVDAWESLQDEYQRTAVVLDHFDEEINGGAEGGIMLSDGNRRRIRIMLLAGGDLIQSMGEPGVWADADLHHILGKYGCMIVERTGADVWSFLLSHDLLWRYRKNLKVVKQTIFNDISSSKVRLFVRRGQSIKYLLPNSVIHYIEQHRMYRLPEELDTEPPDADLGHF